MYTALFTSYTQPLVLRNEGQRMTDSPTQMLRRHKSTGLNEEVPTAICSVLANAGESNKIAEEANPFAVMCPPSSPGVFNTDISPAFCLQRPFHERPTLTPQKVLSDLKTSIWKEDIKSSRNARAFANHSNNELSCPKPNPNNFAKIVKDIGSWKPLDSRRTDGQPVFRLSYDSTRSSRQTDGILDESSSKESIPNDEYEDLDDDMLQLIEGLKKLNLTQGDYLNQDMKLASDFSKLKLAEPKMQQDSKTAPPSPVNPTTLIKFLQAISNPRGMQELTPAEWMIVAKPFGKRAIVFITQSSCHIFREDCKTKAFKFNPLSRYLKKENSGTILDCFVNSDGDKEIVSILDVLYLEGKTVFEFPAEVRYYFLSCKLLPTQNLPCQESINNFLTSSQFRPIVIETSSCVDFHLLSLQNLSLKTLDFIASSSISCSFLPINPQPSSILLIHKQGEYHIGEESEDLLEIAQSHKFAGEAALHESSRLVNLYFDKKKMALVSLHGKYKIFLCKHSLCLDYSFDLSDQETNPKRLAVERDPQNSSFDKCKSDWESHEQHSLSSKEVDVSSKVYFQAATDHPDAQLRHKKIYLVNILSAMPSRKGRNRQEKLVCNNAFNNEFEFKIDILHEIPASQAILTDSEALKAIIVLASTKYSIEDLKKHLLSLEKDKTETIEAENENSSNY